MKKVALTELMAIVDEELQGPLQLLRTILSPFLSAYEFFKDTVKNVKEGWQLLVEG